MPTESREMLAVGIFGSKSRLGDRIETLLRRGRTFSPRASATGVIASAIVLNGLILLSSLAPRWIALAQSAPPSFEVASVKPSPPLPVFFGMVDDPDRFKGSYVTLLDLMKRAYGVELARISGGPSWVSSDRYEVIATLPRGTPQGQIPLMLQTLLSARFRLIVRRDIRTTRVYALVPAKGSPKLKRSEWQSDPSRGGTPVRWAPMIFGAKGELEICCGRAELNKISMGHFVELLSTQTDRPVQDATGIEGEFDISLEWTPDVAGPEPEGTPSPAGPSIYTAVQEQLGLKLETRNVPLEYLVIEHVEKPDAN